VERLLARGLPLGLQPDARYAEEKLAMGPGDALVVYSDGLVEARDDRPLDGDALRSVIDDTMVSDAIVDALLGTRPAAPARDDITVVALQRTR
jgi:serine phosphatase RsbU (regulator of sigma subunit)